MCAFRHKTLQGTQQSFASWRSGSLWTLQNERQKALFPRGLEGKRHYFLPDEEKRFHVNHLAAHYMRPELQTASRLPR